MTKILVVEDDRSLRETLVFNLRQDYTPVEAADAPTAVMMARREKPDLILLDLMLPGGSGLDVCRDIRKFTSAPIIMLTARGDDVDRVVGLEVGADDYVTKPFALRELLARIKANLRRLDLDRGIREDDVFEVGPLRIDMLSHQATVNGESIGLQPREFDLLLFFARHEGTVLTRPRLLAAVWKEEYIGHRTVDTHVRRVRAKLEQHGIHDSIRTVHAVGYVFEPKLEPGVKRGA